MRAVDAVVHPSSVEIELMGWRRAPGQSRATRMVAALAVSVALAGPNLAQDQELVSPISIRDGFLLNQGLLQPRLQPEPTSAWTFDLAFSSANTFAKSNNLSQKIRVNQGMRDVDLEDAFLVDGEALTTELHVSRRLPNDFVLTVSVPVISYSGGWSDRVIQDFHEGLGLGDDERSYFPVNDYAVFIPGTDLDEAIREGEDLGDVGISARWSHAYGKSSHSIWGLETSLELPTGDPETLRGSGHVDAAFGVFTRRSWDRITLHATAHLTYLGGHEALGIGSQRLYSGSAFAGARVTRSTSILLQAGVWESPLAELGFSELSPPIRQISIGIRQIIGSSIVSLAIGENVRSYENSSDLVVQAAITSFWQN